MLVVMFGREYRIAKRCGLIGCILRGLACFLLIILMIMMLSASDYKLDGESIVASATVREIDDNVI